MEPVLKRRKARKGTQSCWECKRRKTRCTFVSPRESVCDGCKSRQTKCIGQDFYEEDINTSAWADVRSIPLVLCSASRETPLSRSIRGGGEDARSLPPLDAWPSPEDLEIIMDMPTSASVLFHGLICMPYSDLIGKGVVARSRQNLLQKYPPDAHPVEVARRLLLLGTFLQGATKESIKRLNTKPHLLVETANRLVTSNDDLVSSLEGIECLMMEAMFYNNAGNLRRAWITHRRAVAIAQIIGLHRGSSPTRTKAIDIGVQDRISPEHMWCRLVMTDRYLSLMLGLPQASTENPFCSPEALASCTPLERMERLESTAGGRILQRANPRDLAETLEVDKLLQDAASLMPPQWWLIPQISDLVGDGEKALVETLRLMSHFMHYYLLAQLHLPYLLNPSWHQKYDYSRITAVNASREILLRFVAFGGSEASAYCRGIDFLAFIASTVLALAHIDARRRRRAGAAYVLDFLAHQRQGDRGLLERTLSCMENIARGGDDALAGSLSDVLRELLAVEAGTSKGAMYLANVASLETAELELSGLDESNLLKIHIPYFGTVTIEKEHSANADWQEVPTESGDAGRMLVPALTIEVDDWALQGVDMALLDNLMWGLAESEELGDQGLAGSLATTP
ncbi:hypothetical protein B0T14DRAFT_416218 [Immersiella caudata]|uniref:Zn(2)-C6 fungal-type domain-containing protein n=1 Tax=Immersiella caudata TaxID=314043 RepID=A0AA39XFR9_9PEZI|nr:hypothetical protein B0T14DRAFT_416218 [Immersiella caudata]